MSKIRLTIELDQQSGRINMNGPLQDRLLCFGMLEMGRVTLLKEMVGGESKQPSRIEVPQLVMPRG